MDDLLKQLNECTKESLKKIEKELQTNDNLKNSIDTLRKKINPQG